MAATTTVNRRQSKKGMSRDAKRAILMWLILLPLAFIIIIPLLYMFSMAFTTEANQFILPIRWIPIPPTLQNFQKIFADPLLPLARWFGNSLLVASVGTVIILIVSSLSGYAFARLEFPGKGLLFSLLLFSLMIPAAITLIPVFLLRQHFYSVPRELEDAARVDGANRFRIYWQICLPLVRGALVALAIFTFLGLWNDLFWPLIVLNKQTNLTLPIGLVVLQQGSYIQRGLAFAGAFVASVPALLFYIIFQRQIIAGITTTGMAGQ